MIQALLIIFLAVPPLVFLRLERKADGSGFRAVLLFFAVCALNYGIILLAAKLAGDAAWARMDSFDLNRNGFIDGSEITAESSAAVRDAANDTGLALAPITGVVYSLFYVGLCHMGSHYWSQRKNRRSAKSPALVRNF
jgi:hypothetical protein